MAKILFSYKTLAPAFHILCFFLYATIKNGRVLLLNEVFQEDFTEDIELQGNHVSKCNTSFFSFPTFQSANNCHIFVFSFIEEFLLALL